MSTSLYPAIILRKGKEQSLDRLHPWVFSGAIASMPESLEEGDLVTVNTHDGRLIGVGHYQIGSITVRMLDFGNTVIDKQFFASRLNDALNLRRALRLARPDNNAYRLVHGEGDFLPGLIIDIYGNTAVLQAHSPGMHYARNTIAMALTELPDLAIANVYYKSETTLPYKARLDPQNDYIIGAFDTNIATENSLHFHIDWLKGQKTGFFIDQRDNRALLQHYSARRKVLNMFCYTGGFSVYALRGDASSVVSVDSSAKAIALTEANVNLNFPDDNRHKAVAEDAFKYLDNMAKGEFDLIVLDRRLLPSITRHCATPSGAISASTPWHLRRLPPEAYSSPSPAPRQ